MEFVLFASGAMAQPSGLLAIAPYAIILGIFYFLILLPMNKRQKKVQEFQSSLKVGDKVITTSGIYGQVTRVSDKSVQVQVAERVRIEFARTAIGGYQGQEPVVHRRQQLGIIHHEEHPLESLHRHRRFRRLFHCSASIRSSRIATVRRPRSGSRTRRSSSASTFGAVCTSCCASTPTKR